MSKRRAPGSRRDRKAASAASQKPAPATSPSEIGSDDQVQQTLDEALANSFPASDPVSIVTSQHEEAWKKDRKREGE
ncbi:MAG TPA: hypothetical protein VGI35_10040 [Steroidobacteraceae bacterium]